jgi:hypothetical protein
MQWSDVVKPPPRRQLRQFAGLFLVVFLALAAWRWFTGREDAWAVGLAVAAVVVGVPGMLFPALVRPIYTGWMVAAFPIGWTVSRVVLGAVFFLLFTPIGLAFKLFGRDLLSLRRTRRESYWTSKRRPATAREYFRQF